MSAVDIIAGLILERDAALAGRDERDGLRREVEKAHAANRSIIAELDDARRTYESVNAERHGLRVSLNCTMFDLAVARQQLAARNALHAEPDDDRARFAKVTATQVNDLMRERDALRRDNADLRNAIAARNALHAAPRFYISRVTMNGPTGNGRPREYWHVRDRTKPSALRYSPERVVASSPNQDIAAKICDRLNEDTL